MSEATRILAIEFPDQPMAPTADLEQERRIAVFDLLECGQLAPAGTGAPQGPYHVSIRLEERRIVLTACNDAQETITAPVPLAPLRKTIKHYFALCDDYADAVRHLPADRIEALDEARRAAHDEGAGVLRQRLAATLTLDDNTARRLFTLVCVLASPAR